MKNIILLINVFVLSFLTGCFEDEGRYDYEKLDSPIWKTNGAILLSFRAGETAKFRGTPYFSWVGDSLTRAAEVTYEWKLGQEILSDAVDFEMPTDELIKRIGMVKFDGKGRSGTFSIIEKNTGITYVKSIHVEISPTNATCDWLVLSENGGNSKFSFIKRAWMDGNVLTYELRENVYPEVNDEELVGTPKFMNYAYGATNIGAMGTATIVTSFGMYEINCENFVKIGNLEEVPVEGNITARYDAYAIDGGFGLQTFVTDARGKLYRRMMSNSNLMGAFGKVPMVLDTKDYQISLIGQTYMGFASIPCYDALNRRVVSIMFTKSGNQIYEEWFPGWGQWRDDGEQYQIAKLCSTQPDADVEITGCAKVWDMPAGTKPLHLWYVKTGGNPFTGNYSVFGMIYNDAVGKTWWTEFATNENGQVKNGGENRYIEFPAGNLPEGTLFLMCSQTGKKESYMLYSKGNEIRYLNRDSGLSDNTFITLEDTNDKVTFMSWAVSNLYGQLFVGTEKGDIIVYNTPYGQPLSSNPKIIKKFNVGGRVISLKELNNENTYYKDQY